MMPCCWRVMFHMQLGKAWKENNTGSLDGTPPKTNSEFTPEKQWQRETFAFPFGFFAAYFQGCLLLVLGRVVLEMFS